MNAIVVISTLLAASVAAAADASPTPSPVKPLTLASFAASTINVIRDDGIAEYLPTIVLPTTQEFRVIEGIPADVDHREAVQDVIRRSGYSKADFFFGVRSGPAEITVGHYRPQKGTEFMQVVPHADGYSTKPLAKCDWWHIP